MHCRFRAFPICAALFPVGAGDSVSRHRPCCSRPRSSALFHRYAILLHAPPSHIVCPRCDSVAPPVPSTLRRCCSCQRIVVLRRSCPFRCHAHILSSLPFPVLSSPINAVSLLGDAPLCRVPSDLSPSKLLSAAASQVCSIPLHLASNQIPSRLCRCATTRFKAFPSHVIAIRGHAVSQPFLNGQILALPYRGEAVPFSAMSIRIDARRVPASPFQFPSVQRKSLPFRICAFLVLAMLFRLMSFLYLSSSAQL